MKRIALALVALVSLFLAGTVVPNATPAQANTIHNTPANTIKLTQWINYGGGQWTSSFYNVYIHSAGGVTSCMNIAPATWPTNGDNINDNSASIVVNGEPYPSAYSNYSVYVFNWVNCNPDGGYDVFPGAEDDALENLTVPHYVNHLDISLYHTITSIGLIPNG